MKHSIPMALEHFSVNVEARVAEFGDLLGKQLHAVHRVAEDDRLVDAQLGRNKDGKR